LTISSQAFQCIIKEKLEVFDMGDKSPKKREKKKKQVVKTPVQSTASAETAAIKKTSK
jgi:hypothetical protein